MKKFYLLFSLLLSLSTLANNVTIVAYQPAPGQFVNTMPKATADADSVSMAQAANTMIERGSLVSLGGFGGYVIAKFDRPITNEVADDYDFRIFGNAYTNSSEPGVVWVSADVNNNGLPDDPWYELYGSEAERSTRPYKIIYYRPTKADDDATTSVAEYISWRDNYGATGFIPKNAFHKQSYYPLWLAADSLVYEGTLLPDNANDVNGDGSLWHLHSYEWGYADNLANADIEGCSFKMEWANDAEGQAANLESIDFVKIHTGINKVNGSTIGECSTEISGIEAVREVIPSGVEVIKTNNYFVDYRSQCIRFGASVSNAVIATIGGQIIATYSNVDVIYFSSLQSGVYVCIADSQIIKIIK